MALINTGMSKADFDSLLVKMISFWEGVDPHPYADTALLPTIGIGFNLRSEPVADAVLKEMGVTDADDIKKMKKAFQDATGVSGKTKQERDAQVGKILDKAYGKEFVMTAPQMASVFKTLFDGKFVKEMVDLTKIPYGKELVALVSQNYNGLIGNGVKDALKLPSDASIRAELWFQIRYQHKDQLWKRRYQEAAMFGLYADPKKVTFDDAVSVYKMFNQHKDETFNSGYKGMAHYDDVESAYISTANNELSSQKLDYKIYPIGRELLPAATALIKGIFVKGISIPGMFDYANITIDATGKVFTFTQLDEKQNTLGVATVTLLGSGAEHIVWKALDGSSTTTDLNVNGTVTKVRKDAQGRIISSSLSSEHEVNENRYAEDKDLTKTLAFRDDKSFSVGNSQGYHVSSIASASVTGRAAQAAAQSVDSEKVFSEKLEGDFQGNIQYSYQSADAEMAVGVENDTSLNASIKKGVLNDHFSYDNGAVEFLSDSSTTPYFAVNADGSLHGGVNGWVAIDPDVQGGYVRHESDYSWSVSSDGTVSFSGDLQTTTEVDYQGNKYVGIYAISAWEYDPIMRNPPMRYEIYASVASLKFDASGKLENLVLSRSSGTGWPDSVFYSQKDSSVDIGHTHTAENGSSESYSFTASVNDGKITSIGNNIIDSDNAFGGHIAIHSGNAAAGANSYVETDGGKLLESRGNDGKIYYSYLEHDLPLYSFDSELNVKSRTYSDGNAKVTEQYGDDHSLISRLRVSDEEVRSEQYVRGALVSTGVKRGDDQTVITYDEFGTGTIYHTSSYPDPMIVIGTISSDGTSTRQSIDPNGEVLTTVIGSNGVTISRTHALDNAAEYVEYLDESGIVTGTAWQAGNGALTGTGTMYKDTIAGGDFNDELAGGANDDDIDGGGGDDTLFGGVGDDVLRGGGGKNTYVFNKGDGHDIIENAATNLADVAIIQFGNGINASSVIARLNGTTLVLSFTDSDDSVVLENWTQDGSGQQFALHFSNGDRWTMSDLVSAAFKASVGDDSIFGTNGDDQIIGLEGNDLLDGLLGKDVLNGGDGNDTLDGGGGDDQLIGGLGDNVFRFGYGDGTDVVLDWGDYQNSNAVGFAEGITATQVTFQPHENDLYIQLVDSPDVLILKDFYLANASNIGMFKFTDGTVITASG